MQNYQNATLTRRFAACIYELLVLIAIWLISAAFFVALFGSAGSGWKRFGLQFILWLITGVYFVWCWHKSGQTLAAQTWKIKLVNAQNEKLTYKQASIRYALTSASMLVFGFGYCWAILDRQQLFLHDRLLKTRWVSLE